MSKWLLIRSWSLLLSSWAMSLIALTISIILVYIVNNQDDRKSAAIQTPEFSSVNCTDCLNEFLDIKHNHKRKKHHTFLHCCLPNTEDLASVLSKVENYQKKQEDRNEHQKAFRHTPVSVHKYLLPSDIAMNFSNVDHVTVLLSTRSNERNSNNHARGVTVHNDGIEILFSGFYYVYSSIYYKRNTDISSEHFPYQTWFHYVYRIRPNSPAMSSVILRTVFTCCPSYSETKDSAYTGGVFYLKAGDIIQVCLSGQGVLGNDVIKESSFLGLYMLTNI